MEAPEDLELYPAKTHALRVSEALNVHQGLLYLKSPVEDGERELLGFKQDPYFYYLSGCNELDFNLTYDIAADQLNIFLPDYSTSHEYYYGTKNTIKDSLQRYDIDGAAYNSELAPFLSCWAERNDGCVYILEHDTAYPDEIQRLLDSWRCSSRLNDTDLRSSIVRCRMIKDAFEIRCLKHANSISAKAHTSVLRKIRTYTNERQIEAQFIGKSIAAGAKYQAYNVIAAAGANAAIMHYSANDQLLRSSLNSRSPVSDSTSSPLAQKPGECITERSSPNTFTLLDAGAEYANYASDVTRTFPLNGHWPSHEAKAIYHLVQRMQDAAVQTVKPGGDASLAAKEIHRVAIEGLLDLGILCHPRDEQSSDIRSKTGSIHEDLVQEIIKVGVLKAFLPHPIGHHIGLDVHDVWSADGYFGLSSDSLPDSDPSLTIHLAQHSRIDHSCYHNNNNESTDKEDSPRQSSRWKYAIYEPGMVLAIEPGLYFNRHILDKVYLSQQRYARYIDAQVLEKYMHIGGVRIEDNFLITQSGCECITTAPKGEEALRIIRGED